jgi:hypothetical protein
MVLPSSRGTQYVKKKGGKEKEKKRCEEALFSVS